MPASGKALLVPELDGQLLAWGDTVPADGATGYAPGCLFINTGLTDNTDSLYQNIGDAASANFNAVTVAADA